MSIKNLESLFRKLDGLEDIALEGGKKAMSKSLLSVQRDAKIYAPVNDGALQASIHVELTDKEGRLEGKVYTVNDHAMYVEFGTGPVGAKSKKEIPPGVAIQYKDKGWLVPVEYFPDYARYGMIAIEINGSLFVPTNGQKAQQFMTPAAKVNKRTLSQNVSIEVAKSLKGMER